MSLERPWTGVQQLRAFRNTPEGRRQIGQFQRLVREAEAANPQSAPPTGLASLLPIEIRHVFIGDLREALAPRYYGDIRYHPGVQEPDPIRAILQ